MSEAKVEKAGDLKIESLSHGLSTLDACAQMLVQVTRMRAPEAMIRGMAVPIQGWIDETYAFLKAGELDENDAEILEVSFWSLGELTKTLNEMLDAGGDGYVAADAMQQTTQEMLETLNGDEEE